MSINMRAAVEVRPDPGSIHEAIASATESASRAIGNMIRAVEDGHVTIEELPAIVAWADKAKADIDRAVGIATLDAYEQSWR